MNIDKAIEIKQHYQYILQDASLPELIEADNISIEALKRLQVCSKRDCVVASTLLPGETK